MSSAVASPSALPRNKPYDYLLKFLLVGDSDVGKEEILSGLDNGASESPYGGHSGMHMNVVVDITVFPLRISGHWSIRAPGTSLYRF